MNPLTDLERTTRRLIYVLVLVTAALSAGYAAIGDLPKWIVFLDAAVGVLGGSTALANLTTNPNPRDQG